MEDTVLLLEVLPELALSVAGKGRGWGHAPAFHIAAMNIHVPVDVLKAFLHITECHSQTHDYLFAGEECNRREQLLKSHIFREFEQGSFTRLPHNAEERRKVQDRVKYLKENVRPRK